MFVWRQGLFVEHERKDDMKNNAYVQCGCGDWHRREYVCDWRVIRAACDARDRYKRALKSIARNTCCHICQEAALVAKKALGVRG